MTVPPFRKAVLDLIEDQGNLQVAVNLGDVSFLDSTALTLFVTAHKAAQMRGGIFAVLNPQPAALKAIRITSLDQVVPVLTDVPPKRYEAD